MHYATYACDLIASRHHGAMMLLLTPCLAWAIYKSTRWNRMVISLKIGKHTTVWVNNFFLARTKMSCHSLLTSQYSR